MKKSFYLLTVFIGVALLTYSSCSTQTYTGRYIKWRASDIEDYQRFPGYAFAASASPFYFARQTNSGLDSLPVPATKGRPEPLLEVLRESGTTAFLVIKNDTLVYETYLNGYQRSSMNTSFSVAKSITSLLTGVALDEQLIGSVDDPVVHYIPELVNTDPAYRQLRLADLLDMRSGIRFKDHDLPWGDKPRAYYHPQLRERVMELPLEQEPGTAFRYNSYNPILVGMVLEKATGLSPARYFEQKLWDNMGMEYAGSWSMDSEASGMTKMESGLNIRAIDFAKFGRLVLNNGYWNGKQLVSPAWLDYSFRIAEQYKLPALGEDIYYRNFWWIYADKKEPNYTIKTVAGTGHLGQFLFIYPQEKIIIVRMGKENKGVDSWRKVFQTVVDHINGK